MSEKTIPIPGRLKNVAIGGHVAGSEDIDAGGGKTQKQVNDETNDTLALHQSEISGLNSQNYVSVSSYSSLPATGSADTIYRVSSWDGNANSGEGAADVTKYTQYAWNGTAYIVINVDTQIGEVFDISEYKAVGGTLAKFADLSAALDNGNNVPVGVRKGGMSVKFVQSSDNKYVQYMYLGTSTDVANFTNVANWEKTNLESQICNIYFSDNTSPVFSNNGTSVGITFTGNVSLIYNNKSLVLINTGTHIFSLTNAQKLVYLNNALTVESVTTLDNGIVIAINSGGSISGGLLAPYYAAYDIKNKEFTVIFSDSIYPEVAKNGTDLAVSFKTATTFFIRQPNGSMLTINHGAESFTIGRNQKLVYDTTMRVVAYNVDNGIVLGVNNGDGYFTSGLLASVLNAVIARDGDYDLINKSFSIFYSDGSYPTVSTSGDSLIVSFASSSTIGFYQNNGKMLLMNHGTDSFTIGKNQKLVYDSILKVVAYNYTTGIVLAFNGGDGYFTSGLLADSLNALISRNIGQSEYLGDFCDNIISVARCGYNISSLTTPPEQTIASYKEAYKNKYRYMLADVQFTSDHVPVALHDETINSVARNADGTTIADPVYLANLTLEQVDEYDFGIKKGAQYADTKIMRIDDFIKWCKMANCVPILEVKTALPDRQDANFLALAAIIKKYAMGEKTIFEADAGHTTAVTLHEEFPLAEIGRTCTANTDFYALVTQTLAVKGDNKVFWYLYLANQTTGQISNNMISLATANGISIGCSELFTESDLNSFLTDANNLICEKVAIRNHPVSYYMI